MGGAGGGCPAWGQLAAPFAPRLGLRLQEPGAEVRLIAHASLLSCFAVANRSRVVRALTRATGSDGLCVGGRAVTEQPE